MKNFVSNQKTSLFGNINRSTQINRKDSFPDSKLNLFNIDRVIFDHLSKNLSIKVMDNGNSIPVPVIYGTPERWESVKKQGHIRDQNGKIQKPIILIKRTGFQKNDRLISPNRHLVYPVEKKYSEKNQYDQFSVLNPEIKTGKVKEIYNITIPDHIILTYEILVWTDFIEQNNQILEKINFSVEDYWGDKNGYKFRTEVSDYSVETEVPSDQDRMVRSSLSLTVYSYLLPESFEDGKATIQKLFSPKKVIVKEYVGDIPNTTPSKDKQYIVDNSITADANMANPKFEDGV